MKTVLVLFAHPRFEQSRTNKALVQAAINREGVTFHDLYEVYPDFHIDIICEKKLLESHDVIIWHHPFYWYSCPPLMKQWIDLVLEYDWAYGPNGNALSGKTCLQVITTGGSEKVYKEDGKNVYTINQFLRPFEQTVRLCKMHYLTPYAVMGTHQITDEQLTRHVHQYDQILTKLQQGKPIEQLKNCVFQEDIPEELNMENT